MEQQVEVRSLTSRRIRKLKIMTWNINHVSDTNEKKAVKLATIRALLRTYEPDVLVLQEVNLLSDIPEGYLDTESGRYRISWGPLMYSGNTEYTAKTGTQYEYYVMLYSPFVEPIDDTFCVELKDSEVLANLRTSGRPRKSVERLGFEGQKKYDIKNPIAKGGMTISDKRLLEDEEEEEEEEEENEEEEEERAATGKRRVGPGEGRAGKRIKRELIPELEEQSERRFGWTSDRPLVVRSINHCVLGTIAIGVIHTSPSFKVEETARNAVLVMLRDYGDCRWLLAGDWYVAKKQAISLSGLESGNFSKRRRVLWKAFLRENRLSFFGPDEVTNFPLKGSGMTADYFVGPTGQWELVEVPTVCEIGKLKGEEWRDEGVSDHAPVFAVFRLSRLA